MRSVAKIKDVPAQDYDLQAVSATAAMIDVSEEKGVEVLKEESILGVDYYDVLGVSMGATTAEIVAAYRRRAREVAGRATNDPVYYRIKEVNSKPIVRKLNQEIIST